MVPGKNVERGTENQKITENLRPCFRSLGGNLNILWEWSWPCLGKGHHLVGFLDSPWGAVTVWWAFLELEFGLRQLPGEVTWNGVFRPTFQNGCQGTGVQPPTKKLYSSLNNMCWQNQRMFCTDMALGDNLHLTSGNYCLQEVPSLPAFLGPQSDQPFVW